MSSNMRVCGRVRPLNQKELGMGASCVLEFLPNGGSIKYLPRDLKEKARSGKQFDFDSFFDMESKQRDVYDAAAKPIV